MSSPEPVRLLANPYVDRAAGAGWTVRWEQWRTFNAREVFTSPDGVEYVRAQSGAIDLEIPMRTRGLPALKLRRRDASAANLLSRAAAAPAASGADRASGSDPQKE